MMRMIMFDSACKDRRRRIRVRSLPSAKTGKVAKKPSFYGKSWTAMAAMLELPKEHVSMCEHALTVIELLSFLV